MIAALIAALALVYAPTHADPAAPAFDARMAASAKEAQALQGPLDGAWLVRDDRGDAMIVLQITDAPNHTGKLVAAWREPNGPSMGIVSEIRRSRGGLIIRLVEGRRLHETIQVRRSGGLWHGLLKRGLDEHFDVTLERVPQRLP
jgi:hypothetical protein